MELAELKKELHASIDEVEDETVLFKLKTVLDNEIDAEDFSYEDNPAFIAALDESIQQADNGEVYSHEEAINIIKNRLWRTK